MKLHELVAGPIPRHIFAAPRSSGDVSGQVLELTVYLGRIGRLVWPVEGLDILGSIRPVARHHPWEPEGPELGVLFDHLSFLAGVVFRAECTQCCGTRN